MSTQTGSEDFSPAEQAYFSSKGADTSALEAEASQEPQNGAQERDQGNSGTEGAPSQAAQKSASDGLDEDAGEEVVVLGKDGKPRAQNGRFVPHQALHAERERRKGVETELQTYRERQARADERLAVLNEIIGAAEGPAQGKAPVDTGPPDAEKDPLGALAHALKKIGDLETQLKEGTKQQSERDSAKAMMSAYQNDAARFMGEKPEFRDSYSYLIEGRHKELEAMGMDSAADRNRFIANEERQLVQQAFQSRKSPAQMLHNLAVARGFAAKAPAAPKQDMTQKIEQVARGQRSAGASLSGSGGSSGEGLTAASLADMNEAEFAATVERLSKADRRRLLGG